MTFYDRLDILLQENNETYSSLSKKLGISRFLIPQAKSRNAELNSEIVKNISELFFVSESWLRWGTIDNRWDENTLENEITPEKIVYRLEEVIKDITKNFNVNDEHFFYPIKSLINEKEIYSIMKRRKNLDCSTFLKISEKLCQDPCFLFTGKIQDNFVDTWLNSIAHKYADMLRFFICLSDENKKNIQDTIINAFFAEKYQNEIMNQDESGVQKR